MRCETLPVGTTPLRKQASFIIPVCLGDTDFSLLIESVGASVWTAMQALAFVAAVPRFPARGGGRAACQ